MSDDTFLPDLTESDTAVLETIKKHGAMKVADIVGRVSINKDTVYRSINRLGQHGHIRSLDELITPGTNNKVAFPKTKIVEITPDGKDFLDEQ